MNYLNPKSTGLFGPGKALGVLPSSPSVRFDPEILEDLNSEG